MWDGKQQSAGGTIPGLAIKHVVVEPLTNCFHGHCQAIKLGNNVVAADLMVNHNATAQLSRTAADGVTTTASTTFTAATAAFTAQDVGSSITVGGASGYPAGTYIAGFTNSTTITTSAPLAAGVTGAAGQTWVVAVPPVQLYNGFTLSRLQMTSLLSSGPSLACGSGIGSQIALSSTLAPVSCPGSTIYPDAAAAQIVQQATNGTAGMILRPFQDYGVRTGYDLQCTNAAGTQTLCDIDANGNGLFNTWAAAKLAGAPGAAIGASFCQTFVVAGTTGGSCKLQAICGTSTTPVTIVDNVGSGC